MKKNTAPTITQLIDYVHQHFGRIYLGGIPLLLSDDGAFLGFVVMLTGIEAIAGFRYPGQKNGDRFRNFVKAYFSAEYKTEASNLWKLRNAAVHAFSPGPFALTHHNSIVHFKRDDENRLILNAEEFYSELVSASQRYFLHLRKSKVLQRAFRTRLKDKQGGVFAVGPIVKGKKA